MRLQQRRLPQVRLLLRERVLRVVAGIARPLQVPRDGLLQVPSLLRELGRGPLEDLLVKSGINSKSPHYSETVLFYMDSCESEPSHIFQH